MEIDTAAIRSIIAARRLRDDMLGPGFGNPGWALLLETYAARLAGRRLCIARLVEETDLAQATAQRWINALVRRGLLIRSGDPRRKNVVLVELSEYGAGRLQAYLELALRLSSRTP